MRPRVAAAALFDRARAACPGCPIDSARAGGAPSVRSATSSSARRRNGANAWMVWRTIESLQRARRPHARGHRTCTASEIEFRRARADDAPLVSRDDVMSNDSSRSGAQADGRPSSPCTAPAPAATNGAASPACSAQRFHVVAPDLIGCGTTAHWTGVHAFTRRRRGGARGRHHRCGRSAGASRRPLLWRRCRAARRGRAAGPHREPDAVRAGGAASAEDGGRRRARGVR